MKKIFIFLTLSFLNMSCSAYKNDLVENQTLAFNQSSDIVEKKVQVIPIAEMESLPEIEESKFESLLPLNAKNLNLEIEKYQDDINKVDLEAISKWAKTEMRNFKITTEVYKNYVIDKVYEENGKKVFKIKLSDLPSHSPLVKRSLYAYPIYIDNKLEKIYITIQGIVEE
jgi:hypothetical protein